MQPQGSWAPAVNLNTLLLTIRVLLAYPNPADGLVADIVSKCEKDERRECKDAVTTVTAALLKLLLLIVYYYGKGIYQDR